MTEQLQPNTVLVLEDEMIVGMDISLSLEEAGLEVAGPFKTKDKALSFLEETTPSFALLDLNLGRGETSEEVAEALTARDCPFVFLTGYGASSHPVIRRFDNAACLSKPVNIQTVLSMIEAFSGTKGQTSANP